MVKCLYLETIPKVRLLLDSGELRNTSLVFLVESVFEIHCSTEGPYNYLYVWGTEMR